MTNRSRACPSQENLLSLDETDHSVVFQLVAESATHLSSEQGVVLQAIEKVVAGMALGYELGDFGRNLS